MGINLFYNQRKVRRVVIGAQTANLYMYIRTENVNYRVATLLTFLYMRHTLAFLAGYYAREGGDQIKYIAQLV